MNINAITQSTAAVRGLETAVEGRVEKRDKTGASGEAERIDQEKKEMPKDLWDFTKKDEYVAGEDPDSAGLYHVEEDEEGNKKIVFDQPDDERDSKSAGALPVAEEEAEPASGPDKKAGDRDGKEKCIANTDEVDAEIRKLKKLKAALEHQISNAGDDPDKQERLQRQLQQTDNELRMKDNDSYRRQHTRFTDLGKVE